MSYQTFAVERDGAVVTVAFARPEKLNPINETVLRELLAIARALQEDETARVVVLTGRGRAFSAGADLAMLSAMADAERRAALTDAQRLQSARTGRRVMEEWEGLDQVTIAAINGYAVGGGLSLAMACDFRIAAAGARLFIPEVRLGVPYMWGSISRLIALVGVARAKELVMTCDEVTAEQALGLGLVNQVVPAAELDRAARALAERLLAKPPMALRRTKEFFRALYGPRAGDVTFADAYLGLASGGSEDMREAVAAFRERRPGAFRDR
jgi:enoyl-CoA hydratase/carnithine racemase